MKSTVCHHLLMCSNSPEGDTLNHFAPFFASDLSHFQCGCQVNTMINNILTWLPRQPHIFFFSKSLEKRQRRRKLISIGILDPERKPGASSPPFIMVLHWNCWALILPVLWLVFLPSRHLFSSFKMFGCVCSEGSKGSCLIKWMLFRKVLMHVFAASLRISKGTHQVRMFTALYLRPWYNSFTIMSLICSITHIFVPKGICLKESLYCNGMVHL